MDVLAEYKLKQADHFESLERQKAMAVLELELVEMVEVGPSEYRGPKSEISLRRIEKPHVYLWPLIEASRQKQTEIYEAAATVDLGLTGWLEDGEATWNRSHEVFPGYPPEYVRLVVVTAARDMAKAEFEGKLLNYPLLQTVDREKLDYWHQNRCWPLNVGPYYDSFLSAAKVTEHEAMFGGKPEEVLTGVCEDQ